MNFSGMKHWIWAAAVSAAGVLGAETVLCDFENEAEFAAWRSLDPDGMAVMSWNRDPECAADGAGSLRMATFPVAESGQRWPGFQLPGWAMRFSDWRPYSDLAFKVVNAGGHPARLCVQLNTTAGGSITSYYDLELGLNAFSWRLPEIARAGAVNDIRFFQNDPSQADVLYLDSIVLRAGGDTAQRLEKLFKRPGLAAGIDGLKGDGIDEERRDLLARAGRLSEAVASGMDEVEAGRTLIALEEAVGEWEKRACVRLNEWNRNRLLQRTPGSPWACAAVHATRKVFREEIPFLEDADRLSLALARREVEAGQIVLGAAEPVRNVRWRTSELKSPSGAVLPAEAVRVMPVGYVDALQPAYLLEDAARWRPDPLLSFLDRFDLEAEVWQPLWVEVSASPETPAGVYTGTVTVSGDGVPDLVVPLEVTVWDFELPLRQSLPNLFTYEANQAHRIYARNDAEFEEFVRFQNDELSYGELSPGARRLRDLEIATEELLLDHRVSPSSLYLVQRPPRPEDVKRWVDRGIACFNIFYVAAQPHLQEGQPYPEERKRSILNTLRDVIPRYEAAGVLPYALIYSFDEIGSNQFAAAADILKEIKAEWPEIPVLTTAFDISFGRKSGLTGLIDQWCPISEEYVRRLGEVAEEREKGVGIWYYTCCTPLPPSLNLLLEQAAVAPRLLLGARAWEYQVDGFLYYQTTLWLPETRITTGPLTDHNGRSAYLAFNGDGMLLYPGPEGPLSSIRLGMVRDGMEDYEYFKLLAGIKARHDAAELPLAAADAAELDSLLDVEANLPGDLSDYDRSGDALVAYRFRIGRFLDRIK